MRSNRLAACAAVFAFGLGPCAAPAIADSGTDREWTDLFDPQGRQDLNTVTADAPDRPFGGDAPIVRRDDASRLHAGRRAGEELIAWLQDGEKAYRERKHEEAMVVFRRIVEADPKLSHAWLRIGNLHHQRRQWFQALTAYRRAASRPGADAGELAEVTRRKALHNLAAINLELARQSLREIERLGLVEGSPDTRATLAGAIDAAQRKLDSLAPPAARPPASSSTPSPTSTSQSLSSSPSAKRNGDAPRIDYIRGRPER